MSKLFIVVAIISSCAWIQFVSSKSVKLDGKFKDCQARWLATEGKEKSGVYKIYPNGTYPVKVWCDHLVNGSFTVIQRRIDGSVSFARNLQDYQVGFGHPQGDYWAGLDAIHHLTTSGSNKLVIHMSDWHGNNKQASYNHFLVMDHTQKYRMYISGFSGNVHDDMAYHNGMYFYTMDYPDQYGCATHMQCGWWFNYCAYTLPNGQYYNYGPYTPGTYYNGIYWKDWLGFGYSLKFISMSLYS